MGPFDAFEFPPRFDDAVARVAVEDRYDRYVGQLIRQVLLTAPGERVHRPEFGAGLRNYVFAAASEESASMARVVVVEALERWLGTLIRVEEVFTRVEGAALEVRVAYTLLARGEQRYLDLEVRP